MEISNNQLLRFTTAGSVVIGGTFANNAYNAVASTRLMFGGGNEPNSYSIGTNMENIGGNYTKLDLLDKVLLPKLEEIISEHESIAEEFSSVAALRDIIQNAKANDSVVNYWA